MPTFILATITALGCLVTYFLPLKKKIFPFSVSIYFSIVATIACLIISTGELSSKFSFLWIFVCLFASIFGLWGVLTALITTAIFTIIQYVTHNPFSYSTFLLISITSLLPLVSGLLIWREKNDQDEIDSDNKAYKNLANELNEVASKSEIVINAIGDGVVAVDNQGVIQLINPAAQTILGWGKQDALALNYKSIIKLLDINNNELDPVANPIQQVLNNNQQIRTNNISLMTKTGKKIIISLVVSPVGDIGSGAIAVFHDVTKERAEEREQAEFISTASHEMRTPVASIEGYLGLALNPQTAQIDDRARDFILKAHASAQHLGHLFQDLLDVSKADDGRISNNPKVVNVITFTNEILEGLRAKAEDKGLEIIFKPIPTNTLEKIIAPEYSVNLDNDHIREILNNLIENAIKYTPAGAITVDINGDEDRVVISVKDSGIGIPTEDLPHLFQKFYRVDNKDTREIGGTGLGLYLSRRLAEIMGGRIWVESAYGSGSTFFLELPRVSNQEAGRLQQEQEIVEKSIAKQSVESATESVIETPTLEQPVPQTSFPQPTETIEAAPQPQIPNNVPRGQALTPEQIAAYVARQRQLAQQERINQQEINQQEMMINQALNRPQNIGVSIPDRR